MSSAYTASGISVSFTATSESWNEQSDSEVNVLGFPGGDAVAISLGGQREIRRTFKALLASRTAYETLRGLRGRAGMLLVEDWDSLPVSAVLKQIQPDPIQTDGQVYAQVQFIIY